MKEIKYFYCKSWFSLKKYPTEIWDKEKAKKAHDEKLTYTVLVGSVESPSEIIVVAGENKFICVGFLDHLLREYLSYDFHEVNIGKIFLSVATYREFDSTTEQVLKGSSYMFKENGTLIIEKECFNPHVLKVSKSSTDISKHYKRYPDFGDYKDILSVEL